MKALVLLNAAAGALAASRQEDEGQRIAAAFFALGVPVQVRSVPGDQLGPAARSAINSDVDVVIAGGGDGTLNAVASALVGTGKPFAFIPLGTLNHLAKELNMPQDIEQACAAIANGTVQPMNVGQVNDRYFLSFSGIGVYSQVVKHRDVQRRVLGRAKWMAMAAAFLRIVRLWPLFRVRLQIGSQQIRRLTPLVFIALSEYQIRLAGLEPHPQGGRAALHLYLANPTTRLGLIWLILRAFIGRLRPHKDIEPRLVQEVEMTSPNRSHFRVALDGEIVDLPTPLRYRLIEDGLTILLPPKPTAGN